MFVSIYYKPSLFNAHTMILIVHIFMNVNKLCLNQHRHDKNRANEILLSESISTERHCSETGTYTDIDNVIEEELFLLLLSMLLLLFHFCFVSVFVSPKLTFKFLRGKKRNGGAL